jgi:L-arabinokinase
MGPRIAVYPSGHGFGHAVRVAEVVEALLERSPTAAVHAKTVAPAAIFSSLPRRIVLHHGETDFGLSQPDGLSVDFEETLARLARLEEEWDRRVGAEARWLRDVGAELVLADIPAVAFDAAAAADVPSIALGNFSWDWMYAAYARERPAFAAHAERAARSYALARALIRLPFHGEMPAFSRVIDVPLIARRCAVSREEARRRLGLPLDRRLVLVGFGGLGFASLAVECLERVPGVDYVTTDGRTLEPVDYVLWLRACDAVLTKPGYGMVAATLVNGVRVLYTGRESFPEFPILARALEELGTASFVPLDDLRGGAIGARLEALLARPVAETALAADGAARAAEIVLRSL